MPLPLLLLIPAITTAIGGAASMLAGAVVYDVIYPRIKSRFNDFLPDILKAAFDDLGIEIDTTKGITDEVMTDAINKAFLSGSDVQLTSLFDRQKMVAGFEKMAVKKVATDLGLPAVESLAGVRDALRDWLTAEVSAQLLAEAGDIVDAAVESVKLRSQIDSAKEPGTAWNAITDTSAEGAAHRLRQRKYRQTHTRVWVERGAA